MGAAMQKYLALTVIFSVMISCTSMSSLNKVLQSDVPFSGGVGSEKEWNDTLKLRRTSWYYEATMTNDLFVGELSKESPFVEWLGTAKKNMLSDCKQFFIAIYRIHNFRRAAKGRLLKPISDKGLREINIVEFKAHMKSHPTFTGLHLDTYQVTGFCSDKNIPHIDAISIDLPAFRAINIL
jgi:hypothetical protein